MKTETDNLTEALALLRERAPRVHCLTNMVTMNAVANALLAIGASAIMGQAPEEAAQITSICHATLLNTGTPDKEKFLSCRLAGEAAAANHHPILLDPVGAGASSFRKEELHALLSSITPDLIRCNLEEATALLPGSSQPFVSGGVESGITGDISFRLARAAALADAFHTTVLLSGPVDVIVSKTKHILVHGGSDRMTRLTGSGCMLSALGAAFLGAGLSPESSALAASRIWKRAATQADWLAKKHQTGIGFFPQYLLTALETMTGCDEEQGGESIEIKERTASPVCNH